MNQPDRYSNPARPRPTALLPPGSNGKAEAATVVIELLMMGMSMPETCWAVFKRQVINLRNCWIWLVDSIESIKRQGLANPKFSASSWFYYKRYVDCSFNNLTTMWIFGISTLNFIKKYRQNSVHKIQLILQNKLQRRFMKVEMLAECSDRIQD
jgi:hypothetical protein